MLVYALLFYTVNVLCFSLCPLIKEKKGGGGGGRGFL